MLFESDDWLAVDIDDLALKLNALTMTVPILPAATKLLVPPLPFPPVNIVYTPASIVANDINCTHFIGYTSACLANKAGILNFYNAKPIGSSVI